MPETSSGTRRRQARLTQVVVLCLFGSGAATLILSASLPDVAADLHTSESALAWTLSGPLIAVAVLTPVFGKLGDLLGHRRMFLAGMVMAVATLVGSAAAWSPSSLIAFRVLYGVGGAATQPTGMAMIMGELTGSARARAMGWFQMAMAGFPVLGLVIGGPIIDRTSWRVLFIGLAPIAAIGLVVASLSLPRSRPAAGPPSARAPDAPGSGDAPRSVGSPGPRRGRARTTIDGWGALTLCVSSASLMLGFDRAGHLGFTHPFPVALFVTFVVALRVFVAVERRAAAPLLRLDYFRRRSFTVPIVVVSLANFVYLGLSVISPLVLRRVFDLGLDRVSLVLLWRPLAFAVGSPLGGHLGARIGARRAAIVGMIGVAVSCVGLAQGVDGDHLWLAVASLIISGAGFGFANPGISSTVLSSADPDDLGAAAGMFATCATMSGVAGIQLLLVVLGESYTRDAFVTVYLVAAVVAVGAAFTALAMQRSG